MQCILLFCFGRHGWHIGVKAELQGGVAILLTGLTPLALLLPLCCDLLKTGGKLWQEKRNIWISRNRGVITAASLAH